MVCAWPGNCAQNMRVPSIMSFAAAIIATKYFAIFRTGYAFATLDEACGVRLRAKSPTHLHLKITHL